MATETTTGHSTRLGCRATSSGASSRSAANSCQSSGWTNWARRGPGRPNSPYTCAAGAHAPSGRRAIWDLVEGKTSEFMNLALGWVASPPPNSFQANVLHVAAVWVLMQMSRCMKASPLRISHEFIVKSSTSTGDGPSYLLSSLSCLSRLRAGSLPSPSVAQCSVGRGSSGHVTALP